MYRSGVSAYPSRFGPPLLCGLLPLSCWLVILQKCVGGGPLLFYLLAVGVCASMCADAGDAADVAGDDQRDE